jgi:ERCC4-related helicase
LVIAPKSILNTTWKKEMEDVLGLEIPSINTEKVSDDLDILNKEYSDKNFIIIIDEAHYFRSSTSQRFSGLSSYLATKDRKLVLITATPVNNSLMDLYNLLSLFINDDEIPGIPSLKGYFSEQQKKLYNNEKVDLDNLLRMFVVRTSRPTAQKLSRNLSFPSRVIDTDGVTYKLPLNPEEISNKIDDMTFIYYDLAVDKQVKGITLPDGLPIGENMQKIMKEKLKELVKVVIKINYFKRIESSIYSFKKSLEKQKEYIEKTVKIAQYYKKFIPPKFKTKIYGDEISGFDLSEIPEDYLEQLSMTDEESNTYIENANKDIGIINSIIEKIKGNEDCKFNTFYKKLKSIKIEGKNGIIIFTSYADTAKFIYDKLSMMDPEIKDKLLLITGNEAHGNNSSDRFEIINYFMNNGGYLVSTDVLSAGQNLQNAQYVFNYDFPWNPVVLIQRTGRIDRLRSPYNEIYIINMTPDNSNKEDPSSLEHFIKIMEKLREKIDGIRQTVGSDASILGETPLPKDFNVILEILKGKNEELDKIDESSKRWGIMLWETDPLDIYEQIKEQFGEEKIRSIPFGSGAYKQYDKNGIFVLYRSYEEGKYNYHWVLRFDDGEIITDEVKILRILTQPPNDNRGEKIDYNNLITEFKKLKEEYINYLKKHREIVKPIFYIGGQWVRIRWRGEHRRIMKPIPKELKDLIKKMEGEDGLRKYIQHIVGEIGNNKLIKEILKTCKPECNLTNLEEKLKELIPNPYIESEEKVDKLPQNMHRVVWIILKTQLN